ncbi:hypothetical protein AYO44_00015 [Planctomycetaceae bacterium SCGC AG-212-F19]|nr:hypothetical protein AYO44_00015 [Planctomycetaceae bacterium SCGC AG-212-F19]
MRLVFGLVVVLVFCIAAPALWAEASPSARQVPVLQNSATKKADVGGLLRKGKKGKADKPPSMGEAPAPANPTAPSDPKTAELEKKLEALRKQLEELQKQLKL